MDIFDLLMACTKPDDDQGTGETFLHRGVGMASHDSGFPKGNAHLRRARRMENGVGTSSLLNNSLRCWILFLSWEPSLLLRSTQWWGNKALRNEAICRRSYLTKDHVVPSRLLPCFAISTFKTLLAAPSSRRSLHFLRWSPRPGTSVLVYEETEPGM